MNTRKLHANFYWTFHILKRNKFSVSLNEYTQISIDFFIALKEINFNKSLGTILSLNFRYRIVYEFTYSIQTDFNISLATIFLSRCAQI